MGEQLVLSTTMAGLTLRRLQASDAPLVFRLVQANRTHLTAHGDYTAQVAARMDQIADELSEVAGRHWRFGVFLESELIGRVDLSEVEPRRYSLGYWLAASQTGRGLATASVRRVLEFGFGDLMATDIYAGVTHGNIPSVSLLIRLGFTAVARFDTYTRFRLGPH